MAKAKTIEQILKENGLMFSPNMEAHYMTELEGIWNEACEESGGEVTDAQVDEYLDVLKNMGLVVPAHREEIEKEKTKNFIPDPEVARMRDIAAQEKVREKEEERKRREERRRRYQASAQTDLSGILGDTSDEADESGIALARKFEAENEPAASAGAPGRTGNGAEESAREAGRAEGGSGNSAGADAGTQAGKSESGKSPDAAAQPGSKQFLSGESLLQEEENFVDPDTIYRIFPAQNKTDLKHKIFLILQVPEGVTVPHHIAGGFMNPERNYAFEYYDGGPRYHMSVLRMSGADIRFHKMFDWLGLHHISVRLSGSQDGNSYYVYRIKAVKPPMDGGGLQEIEDNFLQYMIARLRTSIIQAAEEEVPDQMAMNDLPDIVNFMDCCADTLPANIRQWARKNIVLAAQEGGNPDEQRHAKRALSMMLNIRWKSSYFDPIDPKEARKILDEELYGLQKVKQRVIETIIQINRTHTLPSYGLLLVGPAGTGKSQIAYAVARILKIPSAVFDMSTVRDPEALTGTPRIYSNARPGRIMEAFAATGSSNIVFVINELDKADSETQNGNPADTLLTLLDNLGFTDNYMECQIPTGGVYPIATANDKSRISEPLLSRFAVIDLPDYTPDEKKIIFKDYSMPKVLRRMGMRKDECIITDDAIDAIIDLYRDRPGCRDLEQAAEHLAGNALYEIETERKSGIEFDAKKVKKLLRG